jgi:hypothetical protein
VDVGRPERRKTDNQRHKQRNTGRNRQREKQADNGCEEENKDHGQRQRGGQRDGCAGGAANPQEIITVLYTNAQSIQGKIGELTALAEDTNPDIILLSETWCNDTIDNAVLTLPGYILVTDLRKDRSDTANGIGGGLLVYGKIGLEILTNDSLVSEFNQHCSFRIMTRDTPLNFVLATDPQAPGRRTPMNCATC